MASLVSVGGYDCEFVEPPPSDFQVDCAICHLKLRDPQQVSCCGKNFCDPCIKRIRLRGQQCPTCNSPFTACANNKQSLMQLHVYCTHHSDGNDGCEWTGELGQLDQHLNENFAPGGEGVGCPFVKIKCSYCSEEFQRQCHRFEYCPKRQVKCQYYSQSCRWEGELGELEQHLKCAHVIVNCTFSYAGCEVQLPFKDMPSHMAENVGAYHGLHNQKLTLEIPGNSVLIERLKNLERKVEIPGNSVLIEKLKNELERKVKMIWLVMIASAVIIASSAVIIFFTTGATDSNVTFLQSLQGQYRTIEANVTLLQGQCHAIESNIASLQGQYRAIEANITLLQGQCHATESNIMSLQGQYHAIKANITLQCHALELKVTSLQGQCHAIESNIVSLQGQYRAIEAHFLHDAPHETPVCDSQPSQITQPPVQDNNGHIHHVWTVVKRLVAAVWSQLVVIVYVCVFFFIMLIMLVANCINSVRRKGEVPWAYCFTFPMCVTVILICFVAVLTELFSWFMSLWPVTV